MSDVQKISKEQIIAESKAAGFDVVGFTIPAGIGDAGDKLAQFVALERYGDMAWMKENGDRRANPSVLWPEVRSIIMLGMNYGIISEHKGQAVNQVNDPVTDSNISIYAKGGDYHSLIKKRLKRVASWLYRQTDHDVKVFVDTAPVMEKPLAAAAGIGWQGKHTNLVNRDFGSWLFLGAIYTTLVIAPDDKGKNHCGHCSKCLDICPTNAFPAPYQLDARRCISYLTIEYKGHIAEELRRGMGNHIFGCDDCLGVCPWNKFAQAASEARFDIRDPANNPPLRDLLTLSEQQFLTNYAGSPIKRAGYKAFMRNVLIAAANSRDQNLTPLIVALLDDGSDIVRAMAVWALQQCNINLFLELKEAYYAKETDQDVKDYWR